MKNLKLIIALLISTAMIFSCKPKDDKPGTTPVEPPKVEKRVMTTDEFITEFKFDIVPYLIDTVATAMSTARAKGKPIKVVVVVWFNSLQLTKSGNIYTTTLPANIRHCAFQNLTNMTSTYYCQWHYIPDTIKTCTEEELGPGTIRTFASVTTSNDIHISNVIN